MSIDSTSESPSAVEINPYQSPDLREPVGEYYGVNPARVTLAECRRLLGTVRGLLLFLLVKCWPFRLSPLNASKRDYQVTLVSEDQIAGRANQVALNTVADALKLGFVDLFWHAHDTIGNHDSLQAELRSPDGTVLLGIFYAKTTSPRHKVENDFAFKTRFANGDWLVTTSTKQTLTVPPQVLAEHFPGRPLGEVYQRHLERVESADRDPVRMLDKYKMGEFVREMKSLAFEYHLQRGFYRRLSAVEIERLEQQAIASASENPEQASRLKDVNRFLFMINLVGLVLCGYGIYSDNNEISLAGIALVGLGILGGILSRIYQSMKSRK